MNLARILLAMTALSCIAACHSSPVAPVPPVATTGILFFRTDGPSSIPYAVYVPREYTPDTSWPAVVFLHGSGESGTDGQRQLAQGLGPALLRDAARWPCIVILPQKPRRDELWPAHADAVIAALTDTRARFRIDPNRIALTGLSQGGHGVWTLAAKHPDLFSALAPICGFVDSNRAADEPAQLAARIRHIPVWAFHGDADTIVPVAQTQRMIEALTAAGAHPRLTVYPGVDHDSWTAAYADPDLPAFLLKPRPSRSPEE